MASLASEFDAITRALADALGPDPGGRTPQGRLDPFVDLLQIVLGQQRGVRPDQAIEALDRNGLTDPEALSGADPQELADLLRDPRGVVPAGIVPLLKRVASWVTHHGGMEGLAGIDTETLRDGLRAIRGIGPATAERILLEVVERATFPITRSHYRILIRHGWIDPGAEEAEAREAVEFAAPDDARRLRQLDSWLGSLAKECKVSAPRCDRCPLRPFLPEGGPIEPD